MFGVFFWILFPPDIAKHYHKYISLTLRQCNIFVYVIRGITPGSGVESSVRLFMISLFRLVRKNLLPVSSTSSRQKHLMLSARSTMSSTRDEAKEAHGPGRHTSEPSVREKEAALKPIPITCQVSILLGPHAYLTKNCKLLGLKR